ncbi:hemerythrin domain-containing protein [Actinokineospora sp. HUAS TT18]|uniref:hemerythrin domain-containing protein n=1 Tax=Actinokineospora sp. HUAS TT18 TaxID=3447451 RepID=UPI003F51DF3E
MQAHLSTENGLDSLPKHVHGFALMHVAMRRDARRLVSVAPVLPQDRVGKVADWWKQVRAVIDWHHHTEDDILWPALRDRVPGFAETEKAMHADHAALDDAMDAVGAALKPGRPRGEVEAAALGFDAIIRDHLRAEESVVFKAFCVDLSQREYSAIEQRVITSAPLPIMQFLVPWMLDGADNASAVGAASAMPPPVRLLGTTVLRWNYHRQYRWW